MLAVFCSSTFWSKAVFIVWCYAYVPNFQSMWFLILNAWTHAHISLHKLQLCCIRKRLDSDSHMHAKNMFVFVKTALSWFEVQIPFSIAEKCFRMGLINDSPLRWCNSSDSACCKLLHWVRIWSIWHVGSLAIYIITGVKHSSNLV